MQNQSKRAHHGDWPIKRMLHLILGDVRFKECENDKKAAVEDPNIAGKIAPLLKVDEKKFQWALVNYCALIQGNIEKRRMTPGLHYTK